MVRWKNDGEYILVNDGGGERRLNRQEARQYRNALQWPEEYDSFEAYENRQLLATDADFAKACTTGLIQLGHPRHETKQ